MYCFSVALCLSDVNGDAVVLPGGTRCPFSFKVLCIKKQTVSPSLKNNPLLTINVKLHAGAA